MRTLKLTLDYKVRAREIVLAFLLAKLRATMPDNQEFTEDGRYSSSIVRIHHGAVKQCIEVGSECLTVFAIIPSINGRNGIQKILSNLERIGEIDLGPIIVDGIYSS